jgi:hypothetical protein
MLKQLLSYGNIEGLGKMERIAGYIVVSVGVLLLKGKAGNSPPLLPLSLYYTKQ